MILIYIPRTIKIIFVALCCAQSSPRLICAQKTRLRHPYTFWNMSSGEQVADIYVLELIFAQENKPNLTIYVDSSRFNADLLQFLDLYASQASQDSEAMDMEAVYNKLIEQFGEMMTSDLLLSCSDKRGVQYLLKDIYRVLDLPLKNLYDIFIQSDDTPVRVDESVHEVLPNTSFRNFMKRIFPKILESPEPRILALAVEDI